MDLFRHTVSLGGDLYTSLGLQEPVRDYLTLLGLKTALLAHRNALDTYTELAAGKVPDQKPEPPPRVAKGREALAAACAAAAAMEEAPKGTKKVAIENLAAAKLPAMRAHVLTLSRDTVRRLSTRADVQEHYRRLFGHRTADLQISLLAIAGVADPPLSAAEPDGVGLPWDDITGADGLKGPIGDAP
jgi:hypothetical protein